MPMTAYRVRRHECVILTAKNNAGHFSDYLEIKSKENMETKKDAANSRVRIIVCLIVAIIAILFQIFENMM